MRLLLRAGFALVLIIGTGTTIALAANTCLGSNTTIDGTAGDDVITGTTNDDVI